MKKTIIVIITLLAGFTALSQKKLGVYAVGFYNVENLYDTERDTLISDNEFLPDGPNAWTPEKYRKKLENTSYVISQLAKDHCPAGIAALGVAEIENRGVLEDLVKTDNLADMGLNIVHYDSPDRRGVDVALLYNPKLFQVVSSKAHPYILPDNPNFKTRDQLLVSGLLGGEMVHIIVCHWPSRYGSKSSELREHAASITKQIADSLHRIDSNAKIIIVGDLNDEPTDKSCSVVLNAKKKQSDVAPGELYNTMWGFYSKGIGSLAYENKWSLFDQIIISHALLGKDRSTLKFWKAEIFNREFLLQKEGRNKGYPLRTFSGGKFLNGYSDHFPTLIYLVKEFEQ